MLHFGKEKTDKGAIREKFQNVFREQLDPEGRPVPFSVFKDYMQGVLNGVDGDPEAQVMMVEQFIAEALQKTARKCDQNVNVSLLFRSCLFAFVCFCLCFQAVTC